MKYATLSRQGTRKYNEDYLKVSSVAKKHCFILCDGLGGHGMGGLAAQIACNTFVDELFFCDEISSFLENAFVKAQQKIMNCQNNKKGMKTTAVCMVTDETIGYVGHVGDSRFYGFSKDNYIRTLDHSVPQILVQSGVVDEKQLRHHPKRNLLMKVMGDEWDEPMYELREPLLLQEFDAFLLCSDGFWEFITEDEMMVALSVSQTPREWLDKMAERIEKEGNGKEMDNYSAVAVFNN